MPHIPVGLLFFRLSYRGMVPIKTLIAPAPDIDALSITLEISMDFSVIVIIYSIYKWIFYSMKMASRKAKTRIQIPVENESISVIKNEFKIALHHFK